MNSILDSIDRSTEEGRKAWFEQFIRENRQHHYIENKVLNKIVKAFKAAGNPITKIDDGEEVTKVSGKKEIDAVVFNLDECWLKPQNGGWIRFILGNEWDVICDYTLGLEETLKPVNEWIDRHSD